LSLWAGNLTFAWAANADAAAVDWYSWKGIETYVDHAGLTAFAKALGGSIFGKDKIVKRDKDKIARSRWATVTDVSWSDEYKKWKVAATLSNEEER
jgi:hypothetical protein